jgi:hypothetical protein
MAVHELLRQRPIAVPCQARMQFTCPAMLAAVLEAVTAVYTTCCAIFMRNSIVVAKRAHLCATLPC